MPHLANGRYVVPGAVLVTDSPLGEVYVYKAGQKFGAIAYRGAALKQDWHYTFKKDTELDGYIERWLKGIETQKASVLERRKSSNAGHSFKVGDIVTNSWGYDQTNVDWYRVTKATKNFVWLKPVHASMTDSESGGMSGYYGLTLDENLQPIEGKGPETKHKAAGDNVTMRHGCGSKYTGGEKYVSWYA